MCLALQHLHGKKVLHRDFKTPNIFLTKENVIKVGDFGVAKALDHTLDKASTQIGTPYYLSPELCHGQPYNYKSDMWSMGVVIYETMNLSRPFEASNIASLVTRIVSQPHKPLDKMYR